MKKSKKGAVVRLVIWSLVFALLTATLVIGLWGSAFRPENIHFFSFTDGFSYADRDFTLGGGTADRSVTALDIHWVTGRVTVQSYEGEEIRFEENAGLARDEQLRWKVEDGTLTIYPRKSFWFLGFGSLPEKDLTVYLPQGMIPEEVDITTVSGAVALDALSCPDAAIETVSGPIKLLGCDITELECDTVSGGLTFDGTLQEITWDTVSGNVEIEPDVMPRKIESDTVSGDFTVTMPDGPGFTAEVDSVSGTLKSDFPLQSAGDAERYGDGSANYQFDSVSGDVDLKKK